MPEEEKPPLDKEGTPQQIATFKNSIIPKLLELGVTKLTLNYSGSGDEGSIDGIDVEPEGLALPHELEEQVSALADEFLYAEHDSWETEMAGQARSSLIRARARLSTSMAGTSRI
jgi:hypothetical protein